MPQESAWSTLSTTFLLWSDLCKLPLSTSSTNCRQPAKPMVGLIFVSGIIKSAPSSWTNRRPFRAPGQMRTCSHRRSAIHVSAGTSIASWAGADRHCTWALFGRVGWICWHRTWFVDRLSNLKSKKVVLCEDLRETVAVEVARRNEQNQVSTLVRLQDPRKIPGISELEASEHFGTNGNSFKQSQTVSSSI